MNRSKEQRLQIFAKVLTSKLITLEEYLAIESDIYTSEETLYRGPSSKKSDENLKYYSSLTEKIMLIKPTNTIDLIFSNDRSDTKLVTIYDSTTKKIIAQYKNGYKSFAHYYNSEITSPQKKLKFAKEHSSILIIMQFLLMQKKDKSKLYLNMKKKIKSLIKLIEFLMHNILEPQSKIRSIKNLIGIFQYISKK